MRNTPHPLPREQDAPRPLILLLIAALLLVVAGTYYLIERSGLASNVIGQPMSFGQSGPITDLNQILEATQKRNLLGRDVALWGVPVERVVGDYVFWVGPDANRRVPVVLLGEQTSRQYEAETAINRGDTVAVFGSTRAVQEVRLLDEEWAMQRAEWEHLEQAVIYVSAIRVEHLAHVARGAAPPEAGAR